LSRQPIELMAASSSESFSTRKDTISRSDGRITQEESVSILDELLRGKKLSVAFSDYQQWERKRSSALRSVERRSRNPVRVQLPPTGSFQFPRPGGNRLVRGRREEGQKGSTTSAAEIRVLKVCVVIDYIRISIKHYNYSLSGLQSYSNLPCVVK
jgi:hypothetical protein